MMAFVVFICCLIGVSFIAWLGCFIGKCIKWGSSEVLPDPVPDDRDTMAEWRRIMEDQET